MNADLPATAGLDALCLAGPTAAGKTAAALALASVLPVEVVSVDSALVYRGMDIGTAKPSAAERAAVPHHLIDLIEPSAAYSAAQFVADAQRAMAEIRARGRLPLLVGGTMLYFKALFDGIDALPPADPAIRAALDAEARARGWPALHAELATVDPATAARLAPNDAQRVQRALEVWRATGQPLSSFHSGRFDVAPAAPHRTALVSLEPAERGWLHARIGERFAAMLQDGLVDEVRRLRARGDLHADLPSMRCVGYRQAWAALDAGDPPDLKALQEQGSAATRQLAKRQLTWLRGMPWRHTVACDAPDASAQVVALARRLVDEGQAAA
ncbi:tRNA (adenosine(37)-N6)-dimethylallyltransferase MiaA [Methylibium sp. Pch-M]|uniref:tRNA (adenosine(37)-N6)-dimethylallyltransferase MiaA n=1 Tax=Methylibium sp. Pch-M TaxID=2082386 RepID=UPI0010130DE3|nr:tRNA (adenosine(37)-N6)-dimethylallyltransferase MiaA [Methylibium sp. Pch-M]QAZ41064.1 tRNA (adenosine(37)-N6)-dimethylallyltransferase MiaA [Methylibium sp. Pch-M]